MVSCELKSGQSALVPGIPSLARLLVLAGRMGAGVRLPLHEAVAW